MTGAGQLSAAPVKDPMSPVEVESWGRLGTLVSLFPRTSWGPELLWSAPGGAVKYLRGVNITEGNDSVRPVVLLLDNDFVSPVGF